MVSSQIECCFRKLQKQPKLSCTCNNHLHQARRLHRACTPHTAPAPTKGPHPLIGAPSHFLLHYLGSMAFIPNRAPGCGREAVPWCRPLHCAATSTPKPPGQHLLRDLDVVLNGAVVLQHLQEVPWVLIQELRHAPPQGQREPHNDAGVHTQLDVQVQLEVFCAVARPDDVHIQFSSSAAPSAHTAQQCSRDSPAQAKVSCLLVKM